MIAVLFQVTLRPGAEQDYLAYAAALRVELERMEGFLSIDRFASLTLENKILSLSYWRDEESVARWRANGKHSMAQTEGRERLFADYRLSVAAIIRDYGMFDRAEAPDVRGRLSITE